MSLLQLVRNRISLLRSLKKNTVSLTRAAQKVLDLKIRGEGNVFEIKTDKFHSKSNIKVRIKGNHNKVVIGTGCFNCRSLYMAIYGDNCSVVIGNNLKIGKSVTIIFGNQSLNYGKIEDTHCRIGHDANVEEAEIVTFNSHNKITIGNRCMVSYHVTFYNTDGHPIYDLKTQKLKNYVSDMTISDDCWIGYNATLLKGVFLPRGTIVGWGSVVSKKFEKENCAIAGNPAKVVKEGLTWNIGGDKAYIENKKESAS